MDYLLEKFRRGLDKHLQSVLDQLGSGDNAGLWTVAFNRLIEQRNIIAVWSDWAVGLLFLPVAYLSEPCKMCILQCGFFLKKKKLL